MKRRIIVNRNPPPAEWLAWGLLTALGYSFVIFLLGVFGVMVGAFFGPDGLLWGWWLGSLLAAVGQPLGIVGLQSRRSGNPEKSTPASQPVERAEVRQSAIIGLVLGCLLGAFVGFYLMVGWVWWAFSPWAPQSMRQQMNIGFFEISGSSPTPVFLILGSIVLLGTLGLVLGTLFRVPKDWTFR